MLVTTARNVRYQTWDQDEKYIVDINVVRISGQGSRDLVVRFEPHDLTIIILNEKWITHFTFMYVTEA